VKEVSSKPEGKERILFVDDEAIIVELNKQRLGKLGYRFLQQRAAGLPCDVLKRARLIRSCHYRLHDAGFDRIDLATELLKIRATIPIILCTGYNDALSPERAKEAGSEPS